MTPESDTGPGAPGAPPADAGPGPGGHGGGGGGWVRPVVLVASCLVIGFVGGWVLRGDNGTVTVLTPAESADSGQTATVTAGDTVTAPVTTPGAGGGTSTAPAEPVAPPDRTQITLAVLNGTNTTGLAAKTSGEAEGLGYSGVTAGNAPTTSDPTTVYYRSGQRAAAQRVAKDLQVDAVKELPATGSLQAAVPDNADVVVVLGTG